MTAIEAGKKLLLTGNEKYNDADLKSNRNFSNNAIYNEKHMHSIMIKFDPNNVH